MIKITSVIILCFAITGCSDQEKLVSDCFDRFNIQVNGYYGGQPAFITPLTSEPGSDSFLLSNGFKGYIFEDTVSIGSVLVDNQKTLNFTGRVRLFWPGYANRTFAGGYERIDFEVKIDGISYLLLEQFPKNPNAPELNSHCMIASR